MYGYKHLWGSLDEDDAVADAEVDAAFAADERGDHARAARHFLACADRLARLAVAAGRDVTTKNAILCFENAAAAFANAGEMARHGRPAIEAARATHTHLAAQLDEVILWMPEDCPSK